MNTTNLDKIKELTEALEESIKWLECTEDGTDEQIRRIFGEETVDMLNRHRNIVKKTSEASVFPWDNSDKDSLEQLQALLKETGREVTLQELQEMQRKVIRETAGLPNDEEIEYSSDRQEGI